MENVKIEEIYLTKSTVANMFKLPQHMIDYLWECIGVAKKKKICHKKKLAGHISESYVLDDPQNLIVPNLFKILEKVRHNLEPELDKYFSRKSKGFSEAHVHSLWVNFQKKGDFQPVHHHSGLFSFVIWMDIPYHWKDEAKLPSARIRDAEDRTRIGPGTKGGNFDFLFSNGTDRSISSHTIEMSPEMNGYCCFFPSDLSHMVYPFYTSDKERISISGNITWKENHKEVKQLPFIVSNT